LNQNITAVLFDLDGTLLDTAPDLARSLNTLRQRHQKPPLPIQLIRQVVSHGCPGLIRLGFELGTEHVQYPQLRDDFMALYEGAITAESLPFEGIITVLDALNKQQLPWGIVTNKAEHLARKILTELDLIENCACLIGGDTTPFSKPLQHYPMLTSSLRLHRRFLHRHRSRTSRKHAQHRRTLRLYSRQ
jgi:phosphoglycolate phosphatase-like HAD superfamily hydrolase